MNCPMKLGVSLTAASTPTGVFNQWFEALFPGNGAMGCTVCFAPQMFLRFICSRMWDCPLHQLLPCWVHQLQSCLPCSTMCHLAGSASHCLAGSHLCSAACLLPSYRSGWMCLLYLLGLDFDTVRFSVSSGCFLFLNYCCPSFGGVRRHSVFTYASILARSSKWRLLKARESMNLVLLE